MGSILGGILGGGSSPGQQAQMAGIKGTVGDYQSYRQELAQALSNAMSNASTAYQGTNNALETLYGAPAQKPSAWNPSHVAMPAPKPPASPSGPGAAIGASSGMAGSPMANAPKPSSSGDPMVKYGSALLDPAGLFSGGLKGALF